MTTQARPPLTLGFGSTLKTFLNHCFTPTQGTSLDSGSRCQFQSHLSSQHFSTRLSVGMRCPPSGRHWLRTALKPGLCHTAVVTNLGQAGQGQRPGSWGINLVPEVEVSFLHPLLCCPQPSSVPTPTHLWKWPSWALHLNLNVSFLPKPQNRAHLKLGHLTDFTQEAGYPPLDDGWTGSHTLRRAPPA